MTSDGDDTDNANADDTLRVRETKDSAGWKFVGGIGLGVSLPLLLIGMSTADNPDTPVNEQGRLMAIALPMVVICLCLYFVDQIRTYLRRETESRPRE
ncbi:MAG: hypothetical protein AAGD11_09815 [Planctomycetota bacterium]